jgi:bifunctional pyridoxal-dependent enzyme with beta-cystathionase and maltose regulon repressor activities
LGYGDPAGELSLREAIARHLALSRGITCDASQIVITEGALEGVNLCTLLLSEPGDIAWIEDPGYAGAKSAFAKTGLTMVGMPVDDEGMCWEGSIQTLPHSFLLHLHTSFLMAVYSALAGVWRCWSWLRRKRRGLWKMTMTVNFATPVSRFRLCQA